MPSLLRIASARAHALRARRSLSASSSQLLLLRSKSSSPATQLHASSVLPAADSALPTNAFGNVLDIADWAKHAYMLEPRPTLTAPPCAVQQNVFEPLLLDEAEALTSQEPEAAEIAMNRMFISDADVDKWLADFTIPADQLARCTTDEEVQELRRRYARQLRVECSIYEMAMHKREASVETMDQLHLLDQTNAAKKLVRDWMEPATAFIAAERRKLDSKKHSLDSNTYGPAFLMLEAHELAAIGLNALLQQCLAETRGSKFIKIALTVGKGVQEGIIDKKTRRGDTYWVNLKKKIKSSFMKAKVDEYIADVGLWDKRVTLKVGAALIDAIQRSCFVPDHVLKREGRDDGAAAPAFVHDYVFERNRRAGVIRIDKRILDIVLNTKPSANVLPWTARYLPMIVPPKPWTNVVNGGYLRLHTKMLRQRDATWQMECVQQGAMEPLLKPLNLLADVPWVINQDVLDVILKVWERGGGFGDLPQRQDLELPEWKDEYAEDAELKAQYDKTVRKVS
jgi:DNA-directed RNA polymerase, mitochondrial